MAGYKDCFQYQSCVVRQTLGTACLSPMGCWLSKTPKRHFLPHDLVLLCKSHLLRDLSPALSPRKNLFQGVDVASSPELLAG